MTKNYSDNIITCSIIKMVFDYLVGKNHIVKCFFESDFFIRAKKCLLNW